MTTRQGEAASRRMTCLRRGLGALAALLALAAAAAFLWLRTSLPDIAGSATIAGLSGPVEVARDRHGVPHIFAESEDDAHAALGFVHAQDRLWQMEMMRRAGAGRLAEILGERALPSDRMMRTLGLYRLAEASFARLAPEVRRAIEAYARGVNAYLASHAGALPPEFVFLRHRPEPWRPADSLVWGRIMAIRLGENWRDEALRARLAGRLTERQIEELWQDSEDLPARRAAFAVPEVRDLAADLLQSFPDSLAPITASNAWAVAGERTVSGRPLLANDPHLGLQIPELWYLVRIETPGLSLAGGTVAGVPFVLLGHNHRIAWGFTATHSDIQDLFVERIDPADPNRYLVPNGSAPFALRRETIHVRDGAPVELDVRTTRHGPVVAGLDGKLDATLPSGHVLAFASPALAEDDLTPEALYRLNRARDWRAFEDALRRFHAPQQNIVYADVDGAIALLSPGRVPVRGAGESLAPVPGWTGEYDWTGYVPFEELPRHNDPPSGHLVNANERPAPLDYPHFLGKHFPPPGRALRIRDLLGARDRHDIESFARMQLDAVSPSARDLLPLMTTIAGSDARTRAALALLRAWDGTMGAARPEPLIYAAWFRALEALLAADELGDLWADLRGVDASFVRFALTAGRHWCDDVTTPVTETCGERLETALAEALDALTREYGADMSSWRWGDAHRARFRHMPFGFVPVLRDLFGIAVPASGGIDTINRAAFYGGGPAPFSAVHGPGMRAVYDLAALERSRFVVATGQSGNVFSRHYADMNPLWREGNLIEIGDDRETLRREAKGVLVLTPGHPAPGR